MADLTLKIKGDSKEAQKAVADLRGSIQAQAQEVVRVNQQLAQSSKLSGDVVFSQLTQFRIGLTQIARGDLGGVPNIIKGIQLAGNAAEEVKPKVASLAQTFGLVDTALKLTGNNTVTAKALFGQFQNQLIKAADDSNKSSATIRKAFASFGIEVEQALLNPTKAFRQFLLATQGDSGAGLSSIKRVLGASGDISKLADGIGKAGAQLIEFEQTETAAAAGAKVLETGLSTTTLAVGGITIALVAAAAAMVAMEVAAVKLTLNFAEQSRQLQDVQNQIGLSITTLQEYGAAGQITGLKLEDLVNAQDKLIEKLAGTNKASEDFRKKLIAIGVSAENLKKPAQALEQLLPKLQNLNTDANTSAVAIDLFGKNAQKAANTAKELEANNGALKETFRDLGVVTSGEVVAGGVKLDRQLKLLDITITGLKNKIAVELVPTVTQGLALIVVAVDKLGPAFRVAGQVANGMLIGVVAFAEVARNKIGGIYDALAGIATLDLNRFLQGFARQAGTSFEVEAAKIVAAQKTLNKQLEGQADQAEADAKKTAEERLKRQKEIARLNTKAKTTDDTGAREELTALQTKLRNLEAEYRISNTSIQQRLQERQITEKQYTDSMIAEAERRLIETKRILAQEEAVVDGSNLKPEEKRRELQRIKQDRVEIERETTVEMERIRFEDRQRERQAIEQSQQEILVTLQATNDRKIALIEQQAEQEIITRQDAEQRITAFLLEEINQRIEAQRTLANSFPDGSVQRVLELEKLKQLEVRRAQIEEDGQRRVQGGRERDLENAQNYERTLRQIYEGINRANLEFRATIANTQQEIIRSNADTERRNIEAEFDQERELLQFKLDALREEDAADEETLQNIRARRAALNLQLIALEEEKNARIRAINRQAQVEQELANPNSNRNVLGADAADALNALDVGNAVIDRQTTLFQQVNVAMSNYAQNLRRQLPTAAQTVILSMRAMATAAAASIAAFVSGEATVRQAAAGIVNAALEPYKQKAQAKAAIEFAEAASSFAIGDLAGGLKHTGAGVLWSGVAGLLGGIGNLVAGNRGGAGAAAPSLAGTRQDQNTISTEERFRLRESGPGRPVTTIVLVTDRQMLVKDVEQGLASSYQNDGMAKKIIDNATGGRPF